VTTSATTAGTIVRPAGDVLPQVAWFAAGAAYGFLVPFVFSSVLELQHDVYYGVYFALALGFLAVYTIANHVDLAAFFRTAWLPSLLLGLPASAFVVASALSRDSTDGPSGLYAAFEVVWRGAIYGVVDALLLTAFPALVALSIIGGRLFGASRRLAFAALAFVMTVAITATYHLGYEQFREDGVAGPEFGNIVISLPTLATGNPIGSILAHASMHVTADIHSYETDLFLPPETEAPDD
jgi:hypothetical protein